MSKIRLLSTLLLIMFLMPLYPDINQDQNIIHDDADNYFSGKRLSDSAIVNIFRSIAPMTFNAPDVPRFTFIGKDRKFYCGIGGFIKGTISYDFPNPIENPLYFITSEIPMNNSHANEGLYQMSAGSSNIFFNFVALPGSKYQVGGYVNFNFENDNYGLSLQYAYLTFGGLMAGYNYSTFCNEEAAPPTIDLEGPPTLPLILNTVASYHYDVKNWRFCIGIENPLTSATINEYTALCNNVLPTMPAYVQYSWNDKSSMIRASAVVRTLQYENLASENRKYKTGYGFQLSGKAEGEKLVTYFQGIGGKGITSFTQDMYDQNYDLVPDKRDEYELKLVRSWGGMLGFQYNFSDRLFASATYSYQHFYANHYEGGEKPWDEQIKFLSYTVANLFWYVTENVTFALEYINGIKHSMGDVTKNNNRIQTMIQFNF